MKSYHRVATALDRTEPHVWVPVGTQSLQRRDPCDCDERNARPGIRTWVVCSHYREDRFVIHACGCGEWRLVLMDLSDSAAHVVNPPR